MQSDFDFYINVFQHRDKILVNGYKDGKRQYKSINFKPSLYFETNKNTNIKTLDNKKLEKVEFDSINEYYNFLRQNTGISNVNIYGCDNLKTQWISENFPGKLTANLSLIRKAFIDIETCCELGFPDPNITPEPINAITYYDSILKCYYVFTVKEYSEVNINDKECVIIQCENEKELLLRFVSIWCTNYPDIILGWNSEKFDIPYIIGRINKVLGERYVNKLSPFGVVREKEIPLMGGKKTKTFKMIGIVDLDYLDLYKTFSYSGQQPSYSLKFITTLELGETKLDHEEFANMHLFYRENYQKFIEYNIQDVKLLVKLDEKRKLVNLVTQLAYIAKINFNETFSPVATWESLIYNFLKEQNIFTKIISKEAVAGEYTGAFVKQPVPDRYKWVVSFDLNSLYPSLIRQFNISPEKIVSDSDRNKILVNIRDQNIDNYNKIIDKENIIENIVHERIDTSIFKNLNISLSGSGYMFKRDSKGFLPSIMEYVYNQRRAVKKEMLMHQENVELIKAEIHKRGLKI